MRLWVINFGPNYPGFTEESTEWLNKSKCRWHCASSRNSGQFVQKGKKKWKSPHFLLLYLIIEVKNTPLTWPLSATLWAHRPVQGLQPDSTDSTPHCSGQSRCEDSWGLERWGSYGQKWLAQWPNALSENCIDNKAIIYWAYLLCSRQT